MGFSLSYFSVFKIIIGIPFISYLRKQSGHMEEGLKLLLPVGYFVSLIFDFSWMKEKGLTRRGKANFLPFLNFRIKSICATMVCNGTSRPPHVE